MKQLGRGLHKIRNMQINPGQAISLIKSFGLILTLHLDVVSWSSIICPNCNFFCNIYLDNSAKEVVFIKSYAQIFVIFGGRVSRGSRTNHLALDGNPADLDPGFL